jgi:hypothetical protein
MHISTGKTCKSESDSLHYCMTCQKKKLLNYFNKFGGLINYISRYMRDNMVVLFCNSL